MNEPSDYPELVCDSRLMPLSPDMPHESEVERMAAKARRIAAASARSTVRPWQIAAAVAVIALALGLATTFAPSGAAFARDRALAALVPPDGQVLVFSVEVSSSDPGVRLTTETTWIDASAGSWRTETRDSGGKIVGAKVANGGKVLWTEEAANVLVEETVAPTPEAGLPVWLVTLRDLIAVPDQRVKISKVSIDGETYWRLKNDKSYEDLAPFEAVIATADYRPKRITIGRQGTFGDQDATWTVTDWKSVPSDSLDPEFFSFDQVRRLKPEGTPIQKNQ
jgi:hypothetical protein